MKIVLDLLEKEYKNILSNDIADLEGFINNIIGYCNVALQYETSGYIRKEIKKLRKTTEEIHDIVENEQKKHKFGNNKRSN